MDICILVGFVMANQFWSRYSENNIPNCTRRRADILRCHDVVHCTDVRFWTCTGAFIMNILVKIISHESESITRELFLELDSAGFCPDSVVYEKTKSGWSTFIFCYINNSKESINGLKCLLKNSKYDAKVKLWPTQPVLRYPHKSGKFWKN